MSATVCVTGASGFVGSHIVAALLQRSFHVLALVRDPASHAAQQLRALPLTNDAKLDVEKADVLHRSSLHAAIARSRYVIHSAAIVAGYAPSKSRAQETVDVNIGGSENVVDGVERAPEVEKLIFTSSMAAVISYRHSEYRYSESDWNTSSLEDSDPYSYSKTRAERMLRDRFEQSSRLRGRKLVCINPPVIIGPALSRQHVRTSLQMVDALDRGANPGVPNLFFSFADARDVGRVHVEALENPDIEGRFIMPGHSTSVLELARLMKRRVKDSKAPERVIANWRMYMTALLSRRLSFRFLRRHLGVEFKFDDARLRAHFPSCYRALEETVVDSIQSVRELRDAAR